MKVGDELKFIDKTIKFKGINFDEKDNYKLLRGDFEVIDSRKNTLNFNPEICNYKLKNCPRTIHNLFIFKIKNWITN